MKTDLERLIQQMISQGILFEEAVREFETTITAVK